MLPASVGGSEPELQRLRQHIEQLTGEVQHQQQPRLRHRLDPMQAARAHQKPQARTMPLCPPQENRRIGSLPANGNDTKSRTGTTTSSPRNRADALQLRDQLFLKLSWRRA